MWKQRFIWNPSELQTFLKQTTKFVVSSSELEIFQPLAFFCNFICFFTLLFLNYFWIFYLIINFLFLFNKEITQFQQYIANRRISGNITDWHGSIQPFGLHPPCCWKKVTHFSVNALSKIYMNAECFCTKDNLLESRDVSFVSIQFFLTSSYFSVARISVCKLPK